MTSMIMIHHHYLPMRTSLMHHNYTGTVESVQSGACGELLFWAIVVMLIGFVIYNVIDLWRKK